MSSAATITYELDTIGVPSDEWKRFCEEHDIVHSPRTIGGNVYYQGGLNGVEVHYAEHALRFSTYWMGRAIPDVARLAMIAWRRWGGQISADPEVRKAIVPDPTPAKTTTAIATTTAMPIASASMSDPQDEDIP